MNSKILCNPKFWITTTVLILGTILGGIMSIKSTFDSAIDNVLHYEGGYVNDPLDPGGETKFGISKRSYPNLDIKNLSRNKAIEIYYKDYWLQNRLNELNNITVATKLFNLFVNIGEKNTLLIIQRALRACGRTDCGTMKYALIAVVNDLCADNVKTKELLVALKCETAGYSATHHHQPHPYPSYAASEIWT